MGTSDLTNDLHVRHTADRSPLLYSLSKCVVAARAFRLRVIDGVHLDLNDAEVGGLFIRCVGEMWLWGRVRAFGGAARLDP